ncbi:hypothetical protein HOE04_01165 [archaeon]|mgnify:CR=1 FL=1|jgi:hypothetical protein|nr:hypothetical protein [archaeon]
MFSRFSLWQQRGLEAFIGILPEHNSGPCDKMKPKLRTIPPNQEDFNPEEIAYSYKYNRETGEIEYTIY